ncbi:hypothetical protein BDP27DRAFT_1402302 [Rhodocollybia butyracea]|uniref:Uncharacterized protein n=1 Tax=Rhodocollybia butyracea TaxID=206335 RepID=A0A9P5PQ18_9AGAR|nr:hypothetical protein BDP27DRAFT_1402302 [Rhodocollybia butyracea]
MLFNIISGLRCLFCKSKKYRYSKVYKGWSSYRHAPKFQAGLCELTNPRNVFQFFMLIMKYFTPSTIAFVLLAMSLQAYSAAIPSQSQVPAPSFAADSLLPAAPQVAESQSGGMPQEGALSHHVPRELGGTYYARRDEHLDPKGSNLGRRDVDGSFSSDYLGRRSLPHLESRAHRKDKGKSDKPKSDKPKKKSWSQKVKAVFKKKPVPPAPLHNGPPRIPVVAKIPPLKVDFPEPPVEEAKSKKDKEPKPKPKPFPKFPAPGNKPTHPYGDMKYKTVPHHHEQLPGANTENDKKDGHHPDDTHFIPPTDSSGDNGPAEHPHDTTHANDMSGHHVVVHDVGAGMGGMDAGAAMGFDAAGAF